MKDFAEIAFMGDLYSNEKYISLKKFGEVSEKVRYADLRVCNLECTIEGERKALPIRKTGPNLLADKNIMSVLKCLNVNLVTLANNHVGDFGEEGVRNTIDCLRFSNLDYVGARENKASAYAWYRCVIEGLKIAILSVCENEFGIAKENKAGVTGFDISSIAKAISDVKEHTDHMIVVFHGGNEMDPIPSPEAQRRYRFLIDMGVSAVVGMHTHCPQGYEYYNGGLIVYSLGNLYFPNKNKESYSSWNMGYISVLKLYTDKVDMEILPYRYSILDDGIHLLAGEDLSKFMNYIGEINEIISDEQKMFDYFCAWCLYGGKHYAFCLNWNDNYSEMKDYVQRSIEIQNVFRCESHRELLQNYFELQSKGNADKYKDIWKEIKRMSYIPLVLENKEETFAHMDENIQVKNIDEIINVVQSKNRRAYICGAGKAGVSVYKQMWESGIYIKNFLDNSEALEGTRIGNIFVKNYSEMTNEQDQNAVYIIAIVSEKRRREVKTQLLNMGIIGDDILEIESVK